LFLATRGWRRAGNGGSVVGLNARWVVLGWLLAFAGFVPAAGADEWWAWTSLEFWRRPGARAWVFLGNRHDPQDGHYVQIVSPRFRYAATRWLDLGIGQSLLSIEDPRTEHRFLRWRPEFEINPHVQLSDDVALEWRNRLELRWDEGGPFGLHRSRQRLQVTWKLPQPLGPVTHVFASNEWLTDLNRGVWSENRLVPAGLTWRLGAAADLDIYYMVLSTHAPARAWHHESVIGTFLRVRF
jgi:hypothetical protein